MALYGNPDLTGHERTFSADEIIVTKTDLTGKITYGNRTFYKLAGYEENECLGQQHNIIRHPDMPRAVFAFLWDRISAGEEVFAYVVNRAKNGDHYWVFAHVTPSRNASGEIFAYHSSRRVADKNIVSQHIVPLYKDLLAVEKAAASPSEGMAAALGTVGNLLSENKVGFNELMFSLNA